jgi:hypothetical protein
MAVAGVVTLGSRNPPSQIDGVVEIARPRLAEDYIALLKGSSVRALICCGGCCLRPIAC